MRTIRFGWLMFSLTILILATLDFVGSCRYGPAGRAITLPTDTRNTDGGL